MNRVNSVGANDVPIIPIGPPINPPSDPPTNPPVTELARSTPLIPLRPATKICDNGCGDINIYNNFSCGCCQPCNPPVPPQEDSAAGIMDAIEGEYSGVGRDFTKLLPLEFIQRTTDPILVTMNANWMTEACPCDPCQQLPMSEFVLTRMILDMQGRVLDPEKEMGRMIEAAPEHNAPVISFMQSINPEELDENILPARMVYNMYVRTTDGLSRTVNPYKFIARVYPQYPYKLPPIPPNLPANVGQAAIMDVVQGNYQGVGRDFTKLNSVEFTKADTDPVLVTMNTNWMAEMPTCTCPPQELPMTELVLTRQVLDMNGRAIEPERELSRMIEAAPQMNAPVVSNLKYIDDDKFDEDTTATWRVYNIYARTTQGTSRSVNPYKLMARQYPQRA